MPEGQFSNQRDRWVGSSRHGKDAAEADVVLSLLPFVPLRYQLSPIQLRDLSERGFTAVVAAQIEARKPRIMRLERSSRKITVGSNSRTAPHQVFAFLELLARTAQLSFPFSKKGEVVPSKWVSTLDLRLYPSAYIDEYFRLLGETYKHNYFNKPKNMRDIDLDRVNKNIDRTVNYFLERVQVWPNEKTQKKDNFFPEKKSLSNTLDSLYARMDEFAKKEIRYGYRGEGHLDFYENFFTKIKSDAQSWIEKKLFKSATEREGFEIIEKQENNVVVFCLNIYPERIEILDK